MSTSCLDGKGPVRVKRGPGGGGPVSERYQSECIYQIAKIIIHQCFMYSYFFWCIPCLAVAFCVCFVCLACIAWVSLTNVMMQHVAGLK